MVLCYNAIYFKSNKILCCLNFNQCHALHFDVTKRLFLIKYYWIPTIHLLEKRNLFLHIPNKNNECSITPVLIFHAGNFELYQIQTIMQRYQYQTVFLQYNKHHPIILTGMLRAEAQKCLRTQDSLWLDQTQVNQKVFFCYFISLMFVSLSSIYTTQVVSAISLAINKGYIIFIK